MNPSDASASIAQLYSLTLYLQCRLDVLATTFAVIHRHDTRIGDQTVDEFLKDELRDRLHAQLATLSDNDPVVATEFLRILREDANIEL